MLAAHFASAMSLEGTLFARCVETVFAHWDVLRTVVDNDMGGQHSQEKAEWIPEVVVELFQKEGTCAAQSINIHRLRSLTMQPTSAISLQVRMWTASDWWTTSTASSTPSSTRKWTNPFCARCVIPSHTPCMQKAPQFSRILLRLYRDFSSGRHERLLELLAAKPPPSAAPTIVDETEEVDDVCEFSSGPFGDKSCSPRRRRRRRARWTTRPMPWRTWPWPATSRCAASLPQLSLIAYTQDEDGWITVTPKRK